MSSLTKKWVSISFYRARALSEMKVRSAGIELAWLDGRKARALSELEAQSVGIELAWLTGRKAG